MAGAVSVCQNDMDKSVPILMDRRVLLSQQADPGREPRDDTDTGQTGTKRTGG